MNIRTHQGKTPQIHPSAFVDEAATVIGDVTIGADCSVWPAATVRGDLMPIHIGKCSNIQDGAVLHVTSDSKFVPGGLPLEIGDNVTVGHGAILHACSVKDLSLIGMNATILDGAVVSKNVIVGANSLVPSNKHLDEGFLWLGSPVKKIRPLKDEEIEFLVFSAANYVEQKNKYLKERTTK